MSLILTLHSKANVSFCNVSDVLHQQLEEEDAAREEAAAKGVADKAEHLVRMGVSLRLLAPGLDTDQAKVYWLSHKELKSFNLINSR